MSNVLESLSENGYAILENVFSIDECIAFGTELDKIENNLIEKQSGLLIDTLSRQRQILNIHYLNSKLFLPNISNPKILEVVSSVLNDQFILSNFNASRALQVSPFDHPSYRIHIDSRKPNPNFENTYQIVANICIDDFTEKNGSTVVVRGSHKVNQDPRGLEIPEDRITKAVAPKGSVVFMTGQTWHDIGHNFDGSRRWSIIAYYSCWWIKPTYDFVGACTEEIFSMCNDEQKKLLGFTARPPVFWNKRQNTVIDVKSIPKTYEEAMSNEY